MLSIQQADVLRILTCVIAGCGLVLSLAVILSNVFRGYAGARWLFAGVALFQTFCLIAEYDSLGRTPRSDLPLLLALINTASICISIGTVIRLRARRSQAAPATKADTTYAA